MRFIACIITHLTKSINILLIGIRPIEGGGGYCMCNKEFFPLSTSINRHTHHRCLHCFSSIPFALFVSS